MEQPAVVCQDCTVADDVPSRAEDYFSGRRSTMIRRSWLYCTVLLSARDYWLSAILSFLVAFLLFCTVPLQCLWRDSVTLISTLLHTYFLWRCAATCRWKIDWTDCRVVWPQLAASRRGRHLSGPTREQFSIVLHDCQSLRWVVADSMTVETWWSQHWPRDTPIFFDMLAYRVFHKK